MEHVDVMIETRGWRDSRRGLKPRKAGRLHKLKRGKERDSPYRLQRTSNTDLILLALER